MLEVLTTLWRRSVFGVGSSWEDKERKDQNLKNENSEKLEIHISCSLTYRKQLLIIIKRKAAHLYGLAKLVQCRLEGLHGDRVRAGNITVTLVNNSGDAMDLAVVQYWWNSVKKCARFEYETIRLSVSFSWQRLLSKATSFSHTWNYLAFSVSLKDT